MNADIIEAYLSNIGASYGANGENGLHMVLDCPWCGKAKHMYVNIKPKGKGKLGGFKCFKCLEGGYDFVKLYACLEGLDYKEGLAQLAREARGEYVRLPRAKAPAHVELPPTEPNAEPWPAEYTACWDGSKWNLPVYLEQRGISQKIIAEYELGFCTSGEYAGRIIMPIRSPTVQSWTARAVAPEAFLRYKAGPGAGRLLFGWKQAQGAQTLVVNEGPYDAMAVRQTGLRAVALMGLQLREYQLQLIRAMKCKRIVWMLDATAVKDALTQAEKLPGESMIAAPLGFKDASEALEKGQAVAIRQSVADAIPWGEAHMNHVLSLVHRTRR